MSAVSRNASCPCGSGKRYKQCCGALAGSAASDRVRALLDAALALHRRDVLPEAERMYRDALKIDPDALDAIHMLGAICYRTGRLQQGYALIREALERTGWQIPMIRDNFAAVVSALLRSDEAIAALRSGDEALRARIEADSRRFAAALGVAYAGPTRASTANAAQAEGARVLIVDEDVPVADRDSGSYRLVAIMRILRSLGCALTFTGPNIGFGGPEVDALREAGVEVPCKPDVWSVEHMLAVRGAEFDVVWVSRFHVAAQYVAAIRRCAPRALLVLDTVDLHFLREQREAEIAADPEARRRAAVTRERELAMIREADIALVVSDPERDMVLELLPGADVRVVSNVFAPTTEAPGFAERRGMLFVGWFKHRPNVDAVAWYAKEIWPHVCRHLPDARTYLIGADMPASVTALAVDGIEAVGHVPDLDPYLRRCRMSIAPLRYGAGVKGKIGTSQAAGLPVVATSLAVEGMHLESGRDVLVADSASAFADAVVRLHDDEALWNRLVCGGRDNVIRHFSAEAARPVLGELIAAAAAHRQSAGKEALGATSSADTPS